MNNTIVAEVSQVVLAVHWITYISFSVESVYSHLVVELWSLNVTDIRKKYNSNDIVNRTTAFLLHV